MGVHTPPPVRGVKMVKIQFDENTIRVRKPYEGFQVINVPNRHDRLVSKLR